MYTVRIIVWVLLLNFKPFHDPRIVVSVKICTTSPAFQYRHRGFLQVLPETAAAPRLGITYDEGNSYTLQTSICILVCRNVLLYNNNNNSNNNNNKNKNKNNNGNNNYYYYYNNYYNYNYNNYNNNSNSNSNNNNNNNNNINNNKNTNKNNNSSSNNINGNKNNNSGNNNSKNKSNSKGNINSNRNNNSFFWAFYGYLNTTNPQWTMMIPWSTSSILARST